MREVIRESWKQYLPGQVGCNVYRVALQQSTQYKPSRSVFESGGAAGLVSLEGQDGPPELSRDIQDICWHRSNPFHSPVTARHIISTRVTVLALSYCHYTIIIDLLLSFLMKMIFLFREFNYVINNWIQARMWLFCWRRGGGVKLL
jgi:hypothetical protein